MTAYEGQRIYRVGDFDRAVWIVDRVHPSGCAWATHQPTGYRTVLAPSDMEPIPEQVVA